MKSAYDHHGRWSMAPLLVILSLVGAACGGSASPSPAGSVGETPAPTHDTPAPAAQKITVAGPTALVDLDPQGANAVEDPTTMVAGHVFDTVVADDAGAYVPALATEWTNPDDTTWSFKIRSDVTFTDGTPLTSADIKASIERVIRLDGPLAPLWASLDSVEAPDATTLVVKTTAPFGGMLTNMSLLYVVPAARADEKDFFLKPIGSGPFVVESFNPGENLVLAKNGAYWGGAPKLDQIEFRQIPEVSGRVTALTTGEIDFTWGLPPDQLPAIQGNADLALVSVPSLAHYYQWFNSSHEPFDDVRVRQAMWHALDLDSIVKNLFPGGGEVAQAPIQPPAFGFAAQQPYAYDPALAKQLLADAGYPNGFTTSIQYSSTCCSQIRELTQAMISQWAEIGVTVEAQEKEQAKWVEDLLALTWDMNVAYNVTLTGDANFTIGRLYTCAANRTGYCSAELDRVIQEAQSTLNDAERAQLWGQAAKLIWENAVGVTIMDVTANYAYRTRVQGFEPSPTGNPNFYSVSVSN